MTSGQGESRRKKPRYARQLPVRFGSESRMFNGNVTNISDTGLKIQGNTSFPIHSVLTVFVQFPRQTFRLRARVVWTGGTVPIMGLSFLEPAPHLTATYKAWLHEVHDTPMQTAAADEAQAGETGEAGAVPEPAPDPPGSAAPAEPEPRGPVRRRIETPRGESYDILIERHEGAWWMTVFQMPRQLGVKDPDLEGTYPDYASADRALIEFIRSRS
jgi:hypothetical protein